MSVSVCKKSLLAGVVSLLAMSSAHASDGNTIVVLDEQIQNDQAIVEVYFNTNKKLGRAWIEVVLQDTIFSDDPSDVETALVPGLSFDVPNMKIILQKDGASVVCANVEGPTWLVPLGDTIVPTKNCPITARIDERNQDDGTSVYQVPFLHVEMEVVNHTSN